MAIFIWTSMALILTLHSAKSPFPSNLSISIFVSPIFCSWYVWGWLWYQLLSLWFKPIQSAHKIDEHRRNLNRKQHTQTPTITEKQAKRIRTQRFYPGSVLNWPTSSLGVSSLSMRSIVSCRYYRLQVLREISQLFFVLTAFLSLSQYFLSLQKCLSEYRMKSYFEEAKPNSI